MTDGSAALLAKAKRGDVAALNALLEAHLAMVYRFVGLKVGPDSPELDDIVQETLIGASRSIGSFDGDSDAQVAGWMLSIARHKIADHLRARYSRPAEALPESAAAALADPSPSVDSVVAERDRAVRLRQELALLTPEQEEVLTLRFLLGFDIREVAVITRRPEGAVKSLQHRALASLQKRLGPERVEWA
jgi:RNA polymerase sigma-70 factor (ECF subfamily)